MNTLSNVKNQRGESMPHSILLNHDAYPEAKGTEKGESVKYIPDPSKQWYVFRATRGREDKASDYLVHDGTYTYIAKKYAEKTVGGKRKKTLRTLIPTLVFAYTSAEKADEYVNHTPALSYLSYYYNHFEHIEGHKNPPLIISDKEMDQFIKATCSQNEHILFVSPSQVHYRSGELVRIIEGPFQGVEGRIARVAGQQRVVVSLSKIGLVSTAYIPTAFIRKIEE